MRNLDDPARGGELRRTILGKPSLKRFYAEVYGKYADCLTRCPSAGLVVELGSGGGFAKTFIPDLITTDVIPYDDIEHVVDATRMPFENGSIRLIAMLNVFHHIPDVAAFLAEASRCLTPGGRVLIIDQHPGWISKPILKYLHHEPFRPDAADWSFETTGPLSGANGALAWIVFVRDRKLLETKFPVLRLLRYEPFAPLRYWLCGGLKKWSLLPVSAWRPATVLDRTLVHISQNFGSFVEIEIVRS
jgi:SAM-dependent methyltransferase